MNPILKGGNPADALEFLTGKERITVMIKNLNLEADSADDETALDIDIVMQRAIV